LTVQSEPIGYADPDSLNDYRAGDRLHIPVYRPDASADWQDGIPVYLHPAPPSVAVPEFLLEMSKQMREQPNRMTAHPFWQVRCNRYLPTLEGCSEHHIEVCGDDGVVYRPDRPVSDLHEYLIENHEEWCQQWAEENHDDDDWKEAIECYFDLDCDDLPEELRKIPVQEVQEVVSTHLTQAGAEQFIKRKQHDYPNLFTYVESAYWSPQLRELQDWIISLTAAPSPDHSGDSNEVGAAPASFGSAPELADWLDSLYETLEDGSFTGSKWVVAQAAAKAVRGHGHIADAGKVEFQWRTKKKKSEPWCDWKTWRAETAVKYIAEWGGMESKDGIEQCRIVTTPSVPENEEIKRALVWAMNNMNFHTRAHNFARFVLGRGGNGDFGDCIEFFRAYTRLRTAGDEGEEETHG